MKKNAILGIVLSVLLIALPAEAAFFLHGTGPNNNPPTLFLDNTSPTAATAKYRESVGIKFSGGNLWKEIGTWRVTTTGILTALNDLHVWLGLKNSDDIGTNFDLRVEIYKNDTLLITTGELYCINVITRNPDLAKEVVVSFGFFSPVDFYGTDMLSLKILTRIGTNGSGTFCGGHSNAVGLRLYFDAVSRPSRFHATISENLPPVANAGQDQQTKVGDLVTLDGRESYDPNGDLIIYRWTITNAPSGSSAVLDNPSSVMPTFVPDKPGNYILVLTVNDGRVDSSPDDVVVIAARPNVAPTAIAGPDQSVVTGSQVSLDGRGSFDPDGDPLTYRWQMISLPAGSTAPLDNPTSPTPTFVADKDGQYVILLTVNDGWLDSLPDDVVVISATPNAPPIAYAGNDQIVSRNTMIHLDASGSYDPDSDPLTYNWSIVSRPEGSTSQFDDPTSPKPKILADRQGDYVFRLAVYDGQLYSNPDTVVVKAVNDPPIANAGPDKEGVVGVPVSLDGSGGSDPNGDTLTYQWSIGSAPSGSGVTINNPTSVTPAFTPDLPGSYTIQLVVNDGWVSSAPDKVRIEVIKPNQNPVANPGGPYTGVVGLSVQFNSSGSSDPDGDPITFNWDFGDGATGSGATPIHTYSSLGLYTVTLKVQDGKGGSGSAQTTAQINNPIPLLSSINPSSVVAGSPGFTLILNGDNFIATSIVSFNNQQVSSQYISKTQLQATILSTAIATAGIYPVKVTNPAPGGGETSPLVFGVLNPVPSLSSINPISMVAGSSNFTLTLNGDNFIATSTVSFNNQQYLPTYINRTQLEAAIPSSAIVTPGSYLVKVINPAPGGGEADLLTFTVKPSLQITITSPLDGETLNRAKKMVKGTVRSDTRDIGITVNGILAEIVGNDWIANNVPLTVGPNTITAVATDSSVNKVSKSITITTNTITQPVELTTNMTSGIPPFQVYFSVSISGIAPVSYQLDFEGDGIVDYTGTTFDGINYTYTTEGLFYPTITVLDDQGNTYSDTIAIIVLSKTELDTLLRAKWEGMKGAMANKDVEKALSYFIDNSKEMFRYNFELMNDLLPTIVQEMGEIQMIGVAGQVSEYQMIAVQDGVESSFYVKFIKDFDGLWKIFFF